MVLALEEINDDCYCCVGQLIHENLRLFEEVENEIITKGSVNNFEYDREKGAGYDNYDYNNTSMNKLMSESESESNSDEKEEPAGFLGNFRKGFLFESASKNSRKKMRNEIDVALDSSVERQLEDLEEEFYNS